MCEYHQCIIRLRDTNPSPGALRNRCYQTVVRSPIEAPIYCVSLRLSLRQTLSKDCLSVHRRGIAIYSGDRTTTSSEASRHWSATADMCVANLNVSTQPCAHRWYELRRACTSTNNLANCPERLQLEGWESRNTACPWCDSTPDNTLCDTTHRLFGSTPSATSPTLSEMVQTRSRGSSLSALEPLSRISSMTSVESESDRAQRDRGMNERLDIYLRSLPHEVLPSAAKNYPTYSQSSSGSSSAAEESAVSEFPLIRRTSSGLSRRWKKSVRLSRDMFR